MKNLSILLLEDNTLDAELIKEEMVTYKIDFNSKLVELKKDFIAAIHSFQPDLILSDYNLPQLTGFDALGIAKELIPDIPFILVTGHLSEELAADAIKRGAWDYVLKENLIRLGPAIENALKLKEEKDKNREARIELIKLSSAVKQSANTILITDVEGKIIYTNPKFTKLTGYTVEEALGKKPSILSSEKHNKAYYTKLWKTITSGGIWKGEFYNKSKNGNFFWEQATISPIKDDNGNITNFLAIKEDITERKKVEQELIKSEKFNRAVTQTAAAAIITTDLDGIVTSWNNSAELLFGYSFSEIINTNISKIIPSRYMEGHEHGLRKLRNGETKKVTKQVFEFHGLRKDGNEFPIGLSFSNWEVDNQKYVTTIIRDITERKRAEIELKEAYSEVEQLTKQLEDENISLKEEISLSFNYEDLVYSSVEISDVLTQVEQVSNTDATVLILGETGTGKELIAKAIHNISDRKNEPLIYVNCAAIPSELIESELFGHKKGSFTGATNNRIGKFQLADKGTLFLDEIGEMPLDLQPKLLRAIQNAEISPIGDSKVYKLDIRIIVATNKNLEKEVDAKRFREDLFFRLNVFPIIVPPLRERIDDIPVLIEYFINKYSLKYRKDIKFISSKTLQQLKVYFWPGNVRELENLVERAVITSNNERLVFQEFDNPINKDSLKRNNNHKTLEEVQSNHIIKTLNQCNWKISGEGGAALLLDIKPSTLRDRMKKFGIVRPK